MLFEDRVKTPEDAAKAAGLKDVEALSKQLKQRAVVEAVFTKGLVTDSKNASDKVDAFSFARSMAVDEDTAAQHTGTPPGSESGETAGGFGPSAAEAASMESHASPGFMNTGGSASKKRKPKKKSKKNNRKGLASKNKY